MMDVTELAVARNDAIKILCNVILEFARERRRLFPSEAEKRRAAEQPYYAHYACNVIQDAIGYLQTGNCSGLHTQYFFKDRLMNPTQEDWMEMWRRYGEN